MFTCERGDKGQKEREKDDGSHVFGDELLVQIDDENSYILDL